MSMTLKRKTSIALLFMFVIMLTMVMMSPIAYASGTPSPSPSATTSANPNDPNSVDVQIGPNGELIVDMGGFDPNTGSGAAWAKLIDKYKGFITGVAGIAAVTMVVLFIVNLLKLGSASGNPQAKSQALSGLLWTGIATAGLGIVTVIVGIFYYAAR